MKDRKYKGFLISVGLLIVGYTITHLLEIDAILFKIFIGGLLGLTSAYDITNVVAKKIINGGKKNG